MRKSSEEVYKDLIWRGIYASRIDWWLSLEFMRPVIDRIYKSREVGSRLPIIVKSTSGQERIRVLLDEHSTPEKMILFGEAGATTAVIRRDRSAEFRGFYGADDIRYSTDLFADPRQDQNLALDMFQMLYGDEQVLIDAGVFGRGLVSILRRSSENGMMRVENAK